MTRSDALSFFHPAVAEWFGRAFPEGPTPAQELGWPAIGRGDDTLIAAPTGSGKTLAAFLVAIDRCLRRDIDESGPKTSVVYVSPLRALTVDVAENLEGPFEKITALGDEIGTPVRPLRVAVRNGDTPQSERQAMMRVPPDIIVTTPESLYLLATSRRGRAVLSTVETVIVDEIHALARDKRGSHLSLTLERLDRIVTSTGRRRPTRIGCSATQRPIGEIARLLVGAGEDRAAPDGAARCEIVDVGHRRDLDISIVLPTDELGAVMTTEQLGEIVVSLAELIESHRTTLVFVNTRKMAERVAHLLRGVIGDEAVAAHHGSLSMERRLSVESRLREGALRAVVATASLELGIDVGPVDLVCQLGSPRADRDLSPAGGSRRSPTSRHPEGPGLPDDSRRARRVCRALLRDTCRRARRRAPSRSAFGHPRSTDHRRGRRIGRQRHRRARSRASHPPCRAVRRFERRRLRSRRLARRRRGPHRARRARGVCLPRPREPRPAAPPRRAARGGDVRRRDPRARRLPRRRRSG